MKKYHSQGGTQNPDFPYQVRVRDFTYEMLNWCEAYDDQGATFCRYHVKWNLYDDHREYDRVTFEQEQPALMFALTFGSA